MMAIEADVEDPNASPIFSKYPGVLKDAQMTALAPASAAFEIAIVMPRSLKEPVGLIPSNLTQTLLPSISDKTQA
jgi:hypothetical protein